MQNAQRERDLRPGLRALLLEGEINQMETIETKTETQNSNGDLIYRQDAIDAMAELQGRASSKGELTGISKAWKKIKSLPSAQPKRGEWIDRSEGGRILNPWWESYECNQCGCYGSKAWNFCPNCGSKMRGEHDDK